MSPAPKTTAHRTKRLHLLDAAEAAALYDCPFTAHPTVLEQDLEAQFVRANGWIAAGDNLAVQVTQHQRP